LENLISPFLIKTTRSGSPNIDYNYLISLRASGASALVVGCWFVGLLQDAQALKTSCAKNENKNSVKFNQNN